MIGYRPHPPKAGFLALSPFGPLGPSNPLKPLEAFAALAARLGRLGPPLRSRLPRPGPWPGQPLGV
jgi:hypothetical protein